MAIPVGRLTVGPGFDAGRENRAVAELFVTFFRRDLLQFCPNLTFDDAGEPAASIDPSAAPNFRLASVEGRGAGVELFGARFRLVPRPGTRITPHDRRMIRSIGAVLSLRYHHLFRLGNSSRLELYRGGSEDHYVAAFVEPSAYAPSVSRPSRVASTIQTLRVAALSTYENRRVSTGALLLGRAARSPRRPTPTPHDALPYGVELTALKSIHRLCDGRRTLFLVDREGRLAEIVDIARWSAEVPSRTRAVTPSARAYAAHARATRSGGHVCLVLSPNQEIKLFAGGVQAFAFAHGRWRTLDPSAHFASWEAAVARPELARSLFQAALDLAETRQGGLFVVVNDPAEAIGRLISPQDALDSPEARPDGPPAEGDLMAKRDLHYLARGRDVAGLDPSVLEALACIDGATVVDRQGRLIAFGAILRNDPAAQHDATVAEGARTTAAFAASRFGPVLKISEDGVISCFLDGVRAWEM
ncbi:hypothetical protein EP7_000336 [Isosphaeraceae bacterium EP7]